MKFLRKFLDKQAPKFEPGGKLHKYEALFEAPDTLLFTPGKVTKGLTHVRDALDLKRMMITVVVALLPCLLMAMYNTGYQANLAIAKGAEHIDDWHSALYMWLGFDFDPTSFFGNLIYGAIWFLPVLAVTAFVGGNIEVASAILRKHEVNEGFLVTMFLFPLVLPPTIPLWQVALGIAFAVILAKEVFGGTGMNVLNIALTARAFLFFAYPAEISGDSPWIAAVMVDGMSGATDLGMAAAGAIEWSGEAMALGGERWMNAFLGFMPGSMGETSVLACLLGAFVLVATQIGSWRTMLGVIVGAVVMTLILNGLGSDTNPMFAMPFHWHLVLGGFAFGLVFMATDPVTSAFTARGKLYYGLGIGALVILVRVINPAYPEGMMLAILFMNMFAPLIDHVIVQKNVRRRVARYGL
ncbi:MAG: Na+-transporting NADH:ubiquinone oxidoreductase subunit B [Myxococcota bacterium]|jgi:Na+-transporting NADH:ubiquinone oxidoreductase subunit B